jgi:APA family basic amino acid/polyamine antiporter
MSAFINEREFRMSNHHTIGLFSAMFLVVGNIVGSGGFMLPASLASFGSISLLAWIFTAIGSTCIALVFAKFSTKIHKTGGPHVFIQEALGHKAAFFVAWGYWVLTWIGNAAIVISMNGYLNKIFEGAVSSELLLCIGIFLLVVVTALNVRGLKEATFFQNLTTFLKMLPLVIVPLIAFSLFDSHRLSEFVAPQFTFSEAFNGAAILTLWSFVGIESATVPAESVRNASKTIPRATVYGTLLAAIIYIVGCLALFGGIDLPELASSTAPFALAAEKALGGSFWGFFISIAAVICCIGSLNGWMLVVGQIPYGAAKQGLFPKFFAYSSHKGVPSYSIWASSICIIALLLLTFNKSLKSQFDFIAELATITLVFLFVILLVSYAKLQLRRVWKSHWDILLLMLASSYTLYNLYCAGVKMLLLSTLVVASGIPMYLYMRRNISKLERKHTL